MFRGSYVTQIDEKFRLKVPADFKRLIDEEYGTQFFITSKDGKRAEIFPMKAWLEKEEKMKAVSDLNPAKKRYMEMTSYYGQVVEMDAAGRLLMPQKLREAASLTEEVVVIGMQTTLAVENHEKLKPTIVPMTAEELKALEELGL
ncbi:division/cell wall cluster transcriptional repressor MraZ [Granulicella aggregans]|jgi:MraZ protein|uniref:division/cell wall cluster transcriptional repressor MraZ n=1 Tax=Granulicella aggregans TaxID=474949 RepID=UPI0021E0DBAC|nr:division/cell wall cluster transcriptional repressor MraZ [Granulicella aggregans]